MSSCIIIIIIILIIIIIIIIIMIILIIMINDNNYAAHGWETGNLLLFVLDKHIHSRHGEDGEM